MKNIFYILLLLPTIIFAQYPSNSGQKITLGEQTTADGLVWRGRLADTANLLTNKLDTSVYIVLDTGTRAMWYYRASTTPKWTRLVDSLNNLQGTLSVAKGGTGSATQNFVDLTTTQSIGGAKTFTSEVTATRFNPTANTETGTGMFLPAANTLGFSTNGTEKVRITSAGNLGLGVTPSAWLNSLNAFQIGAAHLFGQTTGTGTVSIGNNNYLNNSIAWIYQYNGKATRYGQYDGQHEWYTAGTGTAGNAISFTQAMTLDALGRLGISTASPTEKLHVSGNGLFTGNLGIGSATPTTSGTGITFPATQSASTNVNTLDDYEEGTFTPSWVSDGATFVYDAAYRHGRYTKIGNTVYVSFHISTTEIPGGTITNAVTISGMPFVSGNVDNSHFSAFNYGYLYNIDWPANKIQATAIMNRNGSAVAMQWEEDSTISGQWLASALRAGSYLIINGFYFVP